MDAADKKRLPLLFPSEYFPIEARGAMNYHFIKSSNPMGREWSIRKVLGSTIAHPENIENWIFNY